MKFYSVKGLAELLGVHPETIRRRLQRSEIKGYKMGKDWKVEEQDFKQYLNELKNKNKEGE